MTSCQPTAKEPATLDTALVKVLLSTSPAAELTLTKKLARNRPQESFGLHGHAEAVNGDQGRRDSNSGDSSDDGRRQSDRAGRTDALTRTNKRKRARKNPLESTRILEGPQHGSLETPPVTNRVSLMIADEKAVIAFYRRILADGQQTLCKKLAKWWIRAINPNKQTNYPYAKGPDKKPPWWPQTPPNNAVGVPTKGTLENGFVRHKEPDHLAKSGKGPLQCR